MKTSTSIVSRTHPATAARRAANHAGADQDRRCLRAERITFGLVACALLCLLLAKGGGAPLRHVAHPLHSAGQVETDAAPSFGWPM